MARFSDDELDRIRNDTDIVALIESYGTKLKPRGGDELIGLCPLHDDREPSLVVNRVKRLWNCLGACGKGGDVIAFVMAAEKCSFRHAVDLLLEGKVGALAAGGTKAANTRRLDSPIAPTAEGRQLLLDVANYYHDRLKESPGALDYLAKRGIDNREAIEHFKIGFSDRTIGLRLPTNRTKGGQDIRSRLEAIGVIKETGHELLRGCITFPTFTADAGVGEIYGRRIDDKSKDKHFYLPGPHAGIFNREAFAASDEIILCESIIDAVTFWAAGYRNVTACFGVNGFTDDLRKALRSHDIKRILIGFDNDEAGNNGSDRIGKELIDEGYELFRIRFPRGMDANSYAKQAAKSGGGESNLHNWMGLVIRNADWIGKGSAPTIATLTRDFLAEARARIAAERIADAEGGGEEASEEAAKEKQPASEAKAVKPPAASPVPALNLENQTLDAQITETGIVMTIGNRVYRVRGLDRNTSIDSMKLNVMVRRVDGVEKFFVDTLDLYAARVRNTFTKEAATELGFDVEVIKRDLGRVLMTLETIQEHKLGELEPKDKPVEIDDADRAAAMELLQSPNLVEKILNDFEVCGIVGEETNKLVGYLAATSRKLGKPLAVVIQSSSAAGKSSLMDAVLSFIPPEEQVGYSAMTGQSLFYMGETNLKHKILSIAEEEGVAQASYALKLLQSEGQLTIASTGKDPGSGRMETQEYHVEGPVMIFLTTTAIDIDEELLNRCIVLTVDENREQTRAIHDQQRENETLDGLLTGKRGANVRKLHQNAQRLLRSLAVVNPLAKELRFIDDQARRRRDHMKYLSLIRSIALLHQHGREVKTARTDDGEAVDYIEVSRSDIALANRLSDQVLGKSIDELPPQTRRLLIELHAWVSAQCAKLEMEQAEFRFTRRMIRESVGWNQTALKKHLDRLLEMEYVIAHRAGGRRVEYELLYDGRGREGQPTMCGLIDVTKLPPDAATITGLSPSKDSSSPLDHPEITPSSLQSVNTKPSKNGAEMI